MRPRSGTGEWDRRVGPGQRTGERAEGETGTESTGEWDRGVGPGQRAPWSVTGTERTGWDRDREVRGGTGTERTGGPGHRAQNAKWT